jgi:hypothetical protein
VRGEELYDRVEGIGFLVIFQMRLYVGVAEEETAAGTGVVGFQGVEGGSGLGIVSLSYFLLSWE